MGFFTDLLTSITSFPEVHAEAPPPEPKSDAGASGAAETAAVQNKGVKSEKKEEEEGGKEEEAEEEEAEEEEEEEVEDELPKLQEECAKSTPCKPYKHHYDECVQRVTSAQESEAGTKEDCVEEFFHILHCSSQCAAPKIWAKLK